MLSCAAGLIKDKIDGVFVIINKLCYSTTRLLNEFSEILARKDLVDSATQTDFEVHNNVGVNIADVTNVAVNNVGVNIADATNAADKYRLYTVTEVFMRHINRGAQRRG